MRLSFNLLMLAVQISEVRASNADHESDRAGLLEFATYPYEGDLPNPANRLVCERAARDGPVVQSECFEKLVVVHLPMALDIDEYCERPQKVSGQRRP